MKRTVLFLLIAFIVQNGFAQNKPNYPAGLTIDPGIEALAKKKKKELNTFKMNQYADGQKETGSLMSMMGNLPLTPVVTIQKTDTLYTFINMIIPWGFQVKMNGDSCNTEVFVSSRDCKCFKTLLSEPMSYGAGYSPDSITLVLSKRSEIVKGDKIYGYIKLSGGNLYHFPNENDPAKSEKWSFDYEGYFELEFVPM